MNSILGHVGRPGQPVKTLVENERVSSMLQYAKLSLSRSLLRRSTSERRLHRLALSIEPALHNWINNVIGTAALSNEHRCHNYFQCFKSTVAAKSSFNLRTCGRKISRRMIFIAVNLVSPPLCTTCETYSSLISLLHLCHALLSTRTSASMRDACTHSPPLPSAHPYPHLRIYTCREQMCANLSFCHYYLSRRVNYTFSQVAKYFTSHQRTMPRMYYSSNVRALFLS